MILAGEAPLAFPFYDGAGDRGRNDSVVAAFLAPDRSLLQPLANRVIAACWPSAAIVDRHAGIALRLSKKEVPATA